MDKIIIAAGSLAIAIWEYAKQRQNRSGKN